MLLPNEVLLHPTTYCSNDKWVTLGWCTYCGLQPHPPVSSDWLLSLSLVHRWLFKHRKQQHEISYFLPQQSSPFIDTERRRRQRESFGLLLDSSFIICTHSLHFSVPGLVLTSLSVVATSVDLCRAFPNSWSSNPNTSGPLSPSLHTPRSALWDQTQTAWLLLFCSGDKNRAKWHQLQSVFIVQISQPSHSAGAGQETQPGGSLLSFSVP